MDGAIQEFRHAVRSLARGRTFSIVAVLTLALGAGANAAVFAVANGVLLKPLPFEQPDRLARLWSNQIERGLTFFSVSAVDLADWRRESRAFEALAAYDRQRDAIRTGDGLQAENVLAARASAELFPLLGFSAVLGRTFTVEEASGAPAPVALVTHGYWRTVLGGSPAVLGSTLTLDGEAHTVIGVLPPEFTVPANPAVVWTPLSLMGEEDRGDRFLRVIGRIKPAYTVEAARRDMAEVTARLAEEYPATNAGWSITVQSLEEVVVGANFRRALLVLLGVVGVVLLIACANVGNLMLVRSVGRRQEIALRLALGASGGKVARLWLTESVLLGLVGGAFGLLLGAWSLELLQAVGAAEIPRLNEVGMTGGVVVFTLAVSVAMGAVLAVIPITHGVAIELSGSLREGPRGSTGSRRASRTRSVLLVAQVSLALTLLVGASLLLRSLWRLQQVELGFEPRGVVIAPLVLPPTRYGEGGRVLAFYRELVARTFALPGVRSAALVSSAPMAGPNSALSFVVEGAETATRTSSPDTDYRAVTPGYFETLRIPLLRGRDFTESDRTGAEVVIVSEALARQHFGDTDPIGKRLRLGDIVNGPWRTIIAVAGDARYQSLETPSVRPMAYLPHRSLAAMTLVVRADVEPGSLAGGIRRDIAALDATLAPGTISAAVDVLDGFFGQRRFQLILFASFAILALVLAAVGMYGVTSYTVAQRTRELGLRMALGAGAGQVLGLMVREGLTLAALGAVTGVAAALALTRVMQNLLFETSARDPLVYAVVVALLLLVAGIASYVPARRATRIDPRAALQDAS